MTQENRDRLLVGLGILVVLALLFNSFQLAQIGARLAAPVVEVTPVRPLVQPTAATISNFTAVNVAGELDSQTLNVSGASSLTGNVTMGGTLAVTGASTLTGAATFSASPIMSSQSITPTDGGTLTVTMNIVTLTPAGAVGVSLGTCTTNTWAVLYNSIAANVVITDTGNGLLAGNQTLGQDDALKLVCIGTKWVQVSAVSSN